jgi:hypothetical protein
MDTLESIGMEFSFVITTGSARSLVFEGVGAAFEVGAGEAFEVGGAAFEVGAGETFEFDLVPDIGKRQNNNGQRKETE